MGQAFVATVICIWVVDSFYVEDNAAATMGQTLAFEEEEWYHIGWEWFDTMLTKSFAKFNAYACNTYRSCCYERPMRATNTSATCMQ